jgi:hypothetical protein
MTYVHTCIYITSALLFFTSFYTFSILLGRLADSDPSLLTNSPQLACPCGIPQARALLALLPNGTALLGHSHLVLSSRKLSTTGLSGRAAAPAVASSVLVLASMASLGGFVVYAFAVTTRMLVTFPQLRTVSSPQRVNTPMICSLGIPASFVTSSSASVVIIVQSAGSSP